MTRTAPTAVSLFLVATLSFGCASGPSEGGGNESDDDPIEGAAGGGSSGSGSGGATNCTTDCGGDGAGGSTGGGDSGFKVTPPAERVVGYLPTYRSLDPGALDFDTLTHLCIAFANPGPSGVDFDAEPAEINALVEAAHQSGVYVLASIAGAAGGQAVEDAIQPGVVDGFVAELLDLVSRYNLDGIDVDIEGSHVSTTYEPFVLKLSAALPSDKLLTAAVATWNGADFSDAALAEYDFINLMSYDHCGSWSDACEHSTYEDSVSELNYWENTRALGVGRVVLGVPFYGYCWGPACPAAALTYAEILAGYPAAQDSDYLVEDGYTISFNGRDTIVAKAVLAEQHGGIMIWELAQDASGDDSLLQVIAEN